MGEEFNLAAASRTEKENVKALRKAGFVPAVVYGSGQKNLNFKIKALDFSKIFERTGESSLINLKIDDAAPLRVVVKDVAKDPVKGSLSHIDFYKVDMKKKITVEVDLNFIGEAPAAVTLGGVLAKAKDSVEITCLPDKLVSHLDVDLSALATMNDVIKMSNLKLPEGIELASDTDEVIVSMVEVVKEEIPVAAPETVVAEPVEGEKTEETPAEDKKKE